MSMKAAKFQPTTWMTKTVGPLPRPPPTTTTLPSEIDPPDPLARAEFLNVIYKIPLLQVLRVLLRVPNRHPLTILPTPTPTTMKGKIPKTTVNQVLDPVTM